MGRNAYSNLHNSSSPAQTQSCCPKVADLSRILLFFTGLCCGVVLSITFFSALRQSRVTFQEEQTSYAVKYGQLDLPEPTPSVLSATHSKDEDFHKDEDLIAQELSSRVRILCLVITTRETYKKNAAAVKSTWGPRCNTLLFIGNFDDSELPVVNLQPGGKVKPWGLMQSALSHVYEHHMEDHDWVLRADDDTFVVVENLRHFLSGFNAADALYLGCRLKTKNLEQDYMSGGAGYVLSKEAVRRAVSDGVVENMCDAKDEEAEDTAMGKCLAKLNATSVDTRDSLGRGRFFPFPPEQLLIPGVIKPDNWFWDAVYYPAKSGFDCCSDSAISFHGVGSQRMQVLNYLVYHLRPYGINPRISPSLSVIK